MDSLFFKQLKAHVTMRAETNVSVGCNLRDRTVEALLHAASGILKYPLLLALSTLF
jgi:hypothetical protein